MKGEKTDKMPRSLRVELRFLEGVRNRYPADAKVLKAIGDLYTQAGHYEAGLEVDLKLSRICPEESEVWYNLGCSLALVGRKDE